MNDNEWTIRLLQHPNIIISNNLMPYSTATRSMLLMIELKSIAISVHFQSIGVLLNKFFQLLQLCSLFPSENA